jgi:hypothetical protein
MKNTCTIWVCSCCMLMHANGECCGEIHGEHNEPWRLLQDQSKITMGMTKEAHECDTRWAAWRERDCNCEIREFSWSSCDGCGSNLGGERHAFTYWFED